MNAIAGRKSMQDIDALLFGIIKESKRHNLIVESLGKLASDDLLLLHSLPGATGPRILISAGFHGDEPAGSFGVWEYLKRESLDSQVQLSILPLFNPTGMRLNQRRNQWNEDPNRGFVVDGNCHPSQEGKLLLKTLPRLVGMAHDGFLSLHEDIDVNGFYLYSYEKGPPPSPITQTLRTVGNQVFSLLPDQLIETAITQDGIIYSDYDSSFEDRLFHEGIGRTMCTETPGKQPFNKRVAVNTALIDAFCQFTKTNN